jgi:hypothetical protein
MTAPLFPTGRAQHVPLHFALAAIAATLVVVAVGAVAEVALVALALAFEAVRLSGVRRPARDRTSSRG